MKRIVPVSYTHLDVYKRQGLTSFDVASTFTPTGFVVIILLIQIGGLGVMTLTSFFAMFFMGNTSLYNQ